MGRLRFLLEYTSDAPNATETRQPVTYFPPGTDSIFYSFLTLSSNLPRVHISAGKKASNGITPSSIWKIPQLQALGAVG